MFSVFDRITLELDCYGYKIDIYLIISYYTILEYNCTDYRSKIGY